MRFHGRNLRKGRISQTGQVYLITTVTHQRTPLFEEWTLARLVAQELHAQADLHTLAWVLMPDHLHWLIQLQASGLSECVRRLKSRTAIAVNTAQKRRGPVWQKGFHDRAVRREEDIRALARYVVANPLRAGLATRLSDYPLWDAIWL